MSELRLDPTTHEWVVIATERARRPRDFIASETRPVPPPFVESCPFCPGNENRTPTERAWYVNQTTGKWCVRVVDNKFTAVKPGGSTRRRHAHPFALSMDAGAKDGALPQMEGLRRVLSSRSLAFTWHVGKGGHNWTYWKSRTGAHLAWHA